MATTRPTVNVYGVGEDAGKIVSAVAMPDVFKAPMRSDVVQFVHNQMNRNRRIAYGVSVNAGYQTSAESWGTGRAVARIPRVPGGGTHRAGQGAFGNMCRGGGMFSPNKTWRRWHRKINVTQKRYALASAIAASSIPGIVMARGHKIDKVPELPLVVSGGANKLAKTREADFFLRSLGCEDDLQKVRDSKQIRAGRGKTRNRRYVMRKGPLVVYDEKDTLPRSLRNIPGVDSCHVDRLNLLKLAPGGKLGRFVVWTEGAFKRLRALYGTENKTAELKKGYHLPRAIMANADLARIINSNEIQSVVRPMRTGTPRRLQHKNPLRNYAVMCRLNPCHSRNTKNNKLAAMPGTEKANVIVAGKKRRLAERREANKKRRDVYYKSLSEAFEQKNKEMLANTPFAQASGDDSED